MADKSPDLSQSLSRGMRIIEFLGDRPDGCALAKIAELTGLNKSTAHRLLKSLQGLGYITTADKPGCYRLTTKFVSVGYKVFSSLNVVEIAAPHLERLNLDTGDTINFAIREGDHCVLVYKLEPTTGLLRTRSRIGQSLHLYCSGLGKVFLAFSPDVFLEQYWERMRDSIVRHTANTIVDIAAMRRELARIREEKVGYDREENEIGVGCIAAPVFDPHHRVDYALSVSLPTARLDEGRTTTLTLAVRAAAKAISEEIGGVFTAALA